MRHIRLASYVLLLAAAAALPHAQQVGPAPVARPLAAEAPLPPEPPTMAAPAASISPTEALPALPTEAQLRAEAERAHQASRPPPLAPVQIPQRVEPLGQGRFLILPREAPLQTDGSLSGAMFRDETETMRPVAPVDGAAPSLDDMRDDMNAVKEEFRAINRDVAAMAAKLATPASPTAPSVTAPSAAAPAVSPPSAPAPPPAALPKPLTLAYQADAMAAPSTVKTWAGKYAAQSPLNLQVITATAAPPGEGVTLARARWQAIARVLAAQGLKIGRVSFIHLKAPLGEQRITLTPTR